MTRKVRMFNQLYNSFWQYIFIDSMQLSQDTIFELQKGSFLKLMSPSGDGFRWGCVEHILLERVSRLDPMQSI